MSKNDVYKLTTFILLDYLIEINICATNREIMKKLLIAVAATLATTVSALRVTTNRDYDNDHRTRYDQITILCTNMVLPRREK
jgi:hypothetical protein